MLKATNEADLKRQQAVSPGISNSLHYFDSLPDSANVRLPVVKALLGCSSATVWRMVKRGQLAPPAKLSSRISAWNVGALRRTLSEIAAGA